MVFAFLSAAVMFGFTVWFVQMRRRGACAESYVAGWVSGGMMLAFMVTGTCLSVPQQPPAPSDLTYQEYRIMQDCVERDCPADELYAQIQKAKGVIQ